MKLLTLALRNFRSYEEITLHLNGRSTLIRGKNGSGKSNILEAIHLLATTKSARAKYDREMIKHEKDIAYISAKILKDNEEITLDMTISKNENFPNMSRKQIKINKVAKSISKVTDVLNTALFTPEDIELIIGSPSSRRKYLDSIFFQIDSSYKKATSDYTKALRQKNKLLDIIAKTGKGYDQIAFWNDKLREHGNIIQQKREGFFEFVAQNLSKHLMKLHTPNTKCVIKYNKNHVTEERQDLYLEKELMSKTTLLGPHRDDFEILWNSFNLASFGSRGQQRTMVIALKLCEIDFIYEKTHNRPILLLDDIFSELDEEHKEAINNILFLQQTIITTANDAGENIEILEL